MPASSKCKSKLDKKKEEEYKLPYEVAPLTPISLSKFRQQCLDKHNEYRQRHCCPPLTYCDELNDTALQWAIHLAARGRMESRHFHNNGENLYLAENIDISGDIPVKRWYDEGEQYEYAMAKYDPCTSHFTQVVWKNTKRLGVGVCICRNKTYVVANYHPPGNLLERFKENVPRPTTDEALCLHRGPQTNIC